MTGLKWNNPEGEIGREMTARELKMKTVYALQCEATPEIAITAWYVGSEGGAHYFRAGAIGAGLILFENKPGELFDGPGRRICVYEYLGEV